jgi:carbonic anhydrase/acetyltransferase-like protein (isoleucine patch superfamily)
MGVPGKIVRAVNDEDLKYLRWLPARYVELAEKYVSGAFNHRSAV